MDGMMMDWVMDDPMMPGDQRAMEFMIVQQTMDLLGLGM